MIAAARLISKLAHKGQVDKAGIDYFTHPEAVAAMLDTPQEKVVGYLHDTVEDTDVTVEETHNMDIRRIRNPRQKDYDRIEKKYKPAYEYLKGE